MAKGKSRKHKTYSDETRELACARVDAGESLSQVAKDMGVAKSTLHSWCRKQPKPQPSSNGSAPQHTKVAEVLGGTQNLKPKQRAFLAAYMEVGNITKAVKVAGVGRTTHYDWLQEEEYREAFAQAEEAAADRLEEEAWRRAVQGTVKPVYYKGKQCGGIREYSDTLLIFLLNGLRPEKFKRLSSHEIKGGLDLRGQVTQRYEYDITQRIIEDPETREAARNLFRRATSLDLGSGREE